MAHKSFYNDRARAELAKFFNNALALEVQVLFWVGKAARIRIYRPANKNMSLVSPVVH